MHRRMKPFHPLEGAQAEASDPLVHAALSASAGTGKTHVLTSRVLRLLLRGTPPAAIGAARVTDESSKCTNSASWSCRMRAA